MKATRGWGCQANRGHRKTIIVASMVYVRDTVPNSQSSRTLAADMDYSLINDAQTAQSLIIRTVVVGTRTVVVPCSRESASLPTWVGHFGAERFVSMGSSCSCHKVVRIFCLAMTDTLQITIWWNLISRSIRAPFARVE